MHQPQINTDKHRLNPKQMEIQNPNDQAIFGGNSKSKESR